MYQSGCVLYYSEHNAQVCILEQLWLSTMVACNVVQEDFSYNNNNASLHCLTHYAASLEKSSSISQEGISFGHYLSWYHILAIALFLWAGWHQYKCHKILADLRKTKPSSNAPTSSDRKPPNSDQPPTINQPPDGGGGGKREEVVGPKYAMPVGDWFRYVSCPHLFAEILIYVALLLCQLFSEPVCTWWLVVVHVTGSLYLSARQMHNWYLEKFEDYPKNRTSLFPGLF